MRHPICRLEEIPDGALKEVAVRNRSLVLIRSGRQVFALRNICPHQGAKLSGGVLTGAAMATQVGDYRLTKDGKILRCPWHNWEYDVPTGRCLNNPERVRVACYEVLIENGQIFVFL